MVPIRFWLGHDIREVDKPLYGRNAIGRPVRGGAQELVDLMDDVQGLGSQEMGHIVTDDALGSSA